MRDRLLVGEADRPFEYEEKFSALLDDEYFGLLDRTATVVDDVAHIRYRAEMGEGWRSSLDLLGRDR